MEFWERVAFGHNGKSINSYFEVFEYLRVIDPVSFIFTRLIHRVEWNELKVRATIYFDFDWFYGEFLKEYFGLGIMFGLKERFLDKVDFDLLFKLGFFSIIFESLREVLN